MRSSLSIQGNPIIPVTLSKDAPFVVSMSLGRSSSNTSQIWSDLHWTCKPSPLENDVSVNVEEVPWAVLFHQHYASWWFPSASRFGPTPFATSYPTTICSFGTSVMLTIVWSLVTNALQKWRLMKSFLTMVFMENPSFWRLNRTKNFWDSWSKPSLGKWSIKVQPTSLKFSHPFPLLLLPFFWAAFAHVATLSSRVRSQPLVFNKVWPS